MSDTNLDDEIYKNLLLEAQEFVAEGNLEGAVEFYKEADNMFPNEQIQKMITELEVKVSEENALILKFEEKIKLRESMGTAFQSTPFRGAIRDEDGSYGSPISSVPSHMQSYDNRSMLDQTNNISMRSLNRSFDVNTYNSLIVRARKLYQDLALSEALELYKEANDLNHNVKLERRIDKIKQQLILEQRKSFSIDHKLEVEDEEEGSEEEEEDDASYTSSESSEKFPEHDIETSKTSDHSNDVKEEQYELTGAIENEYSFDTEQYNEYLVEAKSCLQDGNFVEALKLYREAQSLHHDPKILRRIQKIKERFPVCNEEQECEIVPETQDIPETFSSPIPNKPKVVEYKFDPEAYNNIILSARDLYKSNNLQEALQKYREAFEMNPGDKLQERINKVKEMIRNQNEEEQPEKEELVKEEKIDVERYNRLVIEAREHLNAENIPQALQLYKEAMELNPSPKLQKRINKIQKMMEQKQEEGEDESDEEERKQDHEEPLGDEEGGDSEGSDTESIDEEMKEYYNALIISAKDKIKGKNFAEAIDVLKEANELIPSDKVAAKIIKLQFEIDTKAEEKYPASTDQQLNPTQKKEYNELVSKGKVAQKNSKIEKALTYYKNAVLIYKNEKLTTRISKLEAFLEEEQNDDWYTDMGDGFFLTNEVHEKLYPYQREGVKWMWDLYQKKHGGILGDDMGLGKTIQAIAFIQAMFNMELISTVMLVMPLSLINNWQQEFEKWAPELRIELFHGPKAERERNIRKVIKRGGVALTTYGIIEKNVDFLEETGWKWDYLILDEGHKIKNPTKTSKSVRNVSCTQRLIISGTPIQNNLKELWALFDFVSRGKLLGTMTTFKMHYISPIERGREKDASKGEGRLGTKLAENLRDLIDPYFLRRTKDGLKKNQEGSIDSKINKLSKKNEICVWLKLSRQQESLYRAFITLDTVKDAMNQTKSPLAALTVLKKICDHPRLAINFEALRDITNNSNNELLNDRNDLNPQERKDLLDSLHLPDNPDDELLIAESCKLKFCLDLLDNLCEGGHRTLLFSMSRKILDYIQSMISAKGMLCCRIDGTISKPGERQNIIETFNTDMSYQVFLLTTQVGGVGLNLTSADRVIIYDPSWNPATDSQAVDRAYRIGQTKPVTVYRLLTNGTIEEKIYRKQVFKDSITRQATGDSIDPIRYFTNSQLRELFKLDSTSYSETCQHLEVLHASERAYTDLVKDNIAALVTMGATGCSDHDLLFSHEDKMENTPEEHQFVNNKVEQAKQILKLEASGGRSMHPNDPRNFSKPLGQGAGTAHRPKPEPPKNTKEYQNPHAQNYQNPHDYQEQNYGPEFQQFEYPRNDYPPQPSLPSHVQGIEDTSPYFNNHSTPSKQVINIDDDDERTEEINKKLSLSDYKKRQMSIYDFVEPSPIPQSARQNRSLDNDLPKVYNESPVKQIIENHLNNTPKKIYVIESDEEEAEDLDSTKYDDLNKPECLVEREEEEEGSFHSTNDDAGEGLTDLMGKFTFGQEKNSENEKKSEPEQEVIRRESLKELSNNTPKRRSETKGIKMHTPRKFQDLHKDYVKAPSKENIPSEHKARKSVVKSNINPDCKCGGFKTAISQGYKVTKCKCMCSSDDLDKYNQYLQRGLEHHKSQNLTKAMQYYKRALQFRNDDVTVQKAYITVKKKISSQ